MKPYYEHAGITIFHGDCREILPTLDVVDAVVTDPPFGISFDRATWSDSPEAYPDLMRWLVAESNRIVPVGFVFVFQGMPNAPRWHEWFPPEYRIFAACNNFAQIRPTGVWHSWDPVVFWRNGPNSGRNSGHVNRDYFVGNVAGVFSEKSGHPCPRPIDTMKHICQLATAPSGLIVDPFMGSGSTLLAAKETDRRAVGIEIEERYCEIAARRLSQEVFDFGQVAP
jgi:site-specific DNA-methyltransferase (adenine-specific)